MKSLIPSLPFQLSPFFVRHTKQLKISLEFHFSEPPGKHEEGRRRTQTWNKQVFYVILHLSIDNKWLSEYFKLLLLVIWAFSIKKNIYSARYPLFILNTNGLYYSYEYFFRTRMMEHPVQVHDYCCDYKDQRVVRGDNWRQRAWRGGGKQGCPSWAGHRDRALD